jgi:hypothetical protein
VSTPPQAQYGFQFVEPPPKFQAAVPQSIATDREWRLLIGPGQAVNATRERIVAGNLGCVPAAGILLRVEPGDAKRYAASRSRYYVAGPREAIEAAPSTVATLDGGRVGSADRAALEEALDSAFRREWPNVRDDCADEIARMAASPVGYQRSWATERSRIAAALDRGQATRTLSCRNSRRPVSSRPVSHTHTAVEMKRSLQGA